MDTNVFDNEFLVPDFVLQEVQDIADSGDKMRRTRGRRGLDMLAKMQQNPKVEIRMFDSKGKDVEGQNVEVRISLCGWSLQSTANAGRRPDQLASSFNRRLWPACSASG
jgi:hypothetical protein